MNVVVRGPEAIARSERQNLDGDCHSSFDVSGCVAALRAIHHRPVRQPEAVRELIVAQGVLFTRGGFGW